ncbi:hypothetical protein PAESOLCIP111_03085 [Paenibacillus solanacearum]|uniref:Copper amine oxidase-like N-terminal domain-containing protein n=1 Tax=Paenibacillus solanacearum TaxID=2048548 RepID=A0A916K1W8_9BACL|nr:copper amine oxidase N-terminal domain-containing protein [Paenibacillus solanacearum]CAG7629258.1 hypothetical protein PAESOLCIP111_03085 [Paenibacillus solanacearum]
MKKKMILSLLSGLLLLPASVVYSANPSMPTDTKEITLQLNQSLAEINGKTVPLQAAPILINDTTMVPLRFIGEVLGAEIAWENTTRTITVTYESSTIQLVVDESMAIVKGQPKSLDQPVMMQNQTVLVPLRFIAENFNQHVTYDDRTQSIKIISNISNQQPTQKPQPKKLDKITVDNLTDGRDIGGTGTIRGMFGKIDLTSLVTDNKKNVYFLKIDPTLHDGFVIYRYDHETGLKGIPISEENFTFTYMNKNNTTKQFRIDNFRPRKLTYDETHDRLYLIGDSKDNEIKYVVYEVFPELKMITYQEQADTMNQERNFFTTVNGKEFYYSDLFRESIYMAQEGKESERLTYFTTDRSNNEMASVVKEGQIFIFDKNLKTIYKLTAAQLSKVADVNINERITSINTFNGNFYLATDNKILQLSVDGQVTNYVGLSDIVIYNSGVYNPITKTYDQVYGDRLPQKDLMDTEQKGGARPEPAKLTEFSQFAVDSNGNVIVLDSNWALRRINLFEE